MISFISFSNTNITKKHPRVKFSRASRDKRGHKRGVYLQINVSMIVGPNCAQNTHSSNKNFNFSTYNP